MSRTSFFGLLLLFLPLAGYGATMPPVTMKFVDADDGSPIAGAVALFQAGAYEGTLTGHGGRVKTLFIVEDVTDETGTLRLPAQEFSPRPFFLNTHYNNPSLSVLKPGYDMLVLHNYRRIIAELQDVTSWMYDNKTVKMKRLSAEEAKKAQYWGLGFQNQIIGADDPCAWKKMPRFLAMLERLSEGPDRIGRPLEHLFINDGYYVQRGCGSPKAFFEPYLK